MVRNLGQHLLPPGAAGTVGRRVCVSRSLRACSAPSGTALRWGTRDMCDVHLWLSGDTDAVPGQPSGSSLIVKPGNTLLGLGDSRSRDGDGGGRATAWRPAGLGSPFHIQPLRFQPQLGSPTGQQPPWSPAVLTHESEGRWPRWELLLVRERCGFPLRGRVWEGVTRGQTLRTCGTLLSLYCCLRGNC